MKLACARAGFVLQARVAGLSTAASLFLEEHLVSCIDCQARANLLSGLRTLHSAASTELTGSQRERVIEAALSNASRAHAHAPALLGRSRAYLLLPAFAAMALFVAARMYHNRAQPPVQPDQLAAHEPGTHSGDRVLAGQLTALGLGAAITDGERLNTGDGALVALAHAKVQLQPGSSAIWSASRHEVLLEHGSLLVDVDPQPHERFSVRTESFSVLVLGTRFEVSTSTVKVLHGRVSVRSAAGEELAQLDAAGQSRWSKTVLPSGGAPLPVTKPTNVPAAEPVLRVATAPVTMRVQPQALLEQAQQQLVERHVSDARHSLELAQHLPLTNTQRAESLTLYAECALVEGNYQAARSAYLKVAQRFASVPAGETALFAAARIAAEHGSSTDATLLLGRYLERYPSGRFVKEAEARLRSVTAKPAP